MIFGKTSGMMKSSVRQFDIFFNNGSGLTSPPPRPRRGANPKTSVSRKGSLPLGEGFFESQILGKISSVD